MLAVINATTMCYIKKFIFYVTTTATNAHVRE